MMWGQCNRIWAVVVKLPFKFLLLQHILKLSALKIIQIIFLVLAFRCLDTKTPTSISIFLTGISLCLFEEEDRKLKGKGKLRGYRKMARTPQYIYCPMKDVLSMPNSNLKVFYTGVTGAGGYQTWDIVFRRKTCQHPLEHFTELLSRSLVTHNVLRETNSSAT